MKHDEFIALLVQNGWELYEENNYRKRINTTWYRYKVKPRSWKMYIQGEIFGRNVWISSHSSTFARQCPPIF